MQAVVQNEKLSSDLKWKTKAILDKILKTVEKKVTSSRADELYNTGKLQ